MSLRAFSFRFLVTLPTYIDCWAHEQIDAGKIFVSSLSHRLASVITQYFGVPQAVPVEVELREHPFCA